MNRFWGYCGTQMPGDFAWRLATIAADEVALDLLWILSHKDDPEAVAQRVQELLS